MKHKEEKKIQFGGWSKRPYSQVRAKLEIMFLEEAEPRVRRFKKKRVCKFNKGVHDFEKHEKDFLSRIYCQFICKNCGKQKWS